MAFEPYRYTWYLKQVMAGLPYIKIYNTYSTESKMFFNLKGHGNEADFLGFLQKLGPHRSLTLPSSCSAFGFEFAEIFVIEKRLSDSASRGVDDSPTRRVGESAFECLKEKLGGSESRRLPDSANRGVANSPTQRVGELSTPRLGESGRRHGESGSRYSNFLKFSIDFPDFKRLNKPFKRSIWQKRSQGCNVLLPLIYLTH